MTNGKLRLRFTIRDMLGFAAVPWILFMIYIYISETERSSQYEMKIWTYIFSPTTQPGISRLFYLYATSWALILIKIYMIFIYRTFVANRYTCFHEKIKIMLNKLVFKLRLCRIDTKCQSTKHNPFLK